MSKLKIGMIVLVVSDGAPGEPNTTHPNVGAIARITATTPGCSHRHPTRYITSLHSCVRVDDGPAWRQSDATHFHDGLQRGFYEDELQPLDPGIAALYGVDAT